MLYFVFSSTGSEVLKKMPRKSWNMTFLSQLIGKIYMTKRCVLVCCLHVIGILFHEIIGNCGTGKGGGVVDGLIWCGLGDGFGFEPLLI